jgi:hypothetical protein
MRYEEHPLCNSAASARLSGIATGDDRHWKPSREEILGVGLCAQCGVQAALTSNDVHAVWDSRLRNYVEKRSTDR